VPLFGKTRRSGQQKETTPQPLFEEVTSQEFSLKLSYSAKSSEGVRLKAGPAMVARLASMLDGYVKGLSELVEPVPPEMVSARRSSPVCPAAPNGSNTTTSAVR